jgi:uncharacterized protein YcnI
MKTAFVPLAAAAALALTCGAALAHVTLETAQAVSNSYFKATFSVPHGCEGTPTIRVRVRIPDGVTSVKPQPKTGWEVATVKEKLDKPVEIGHGVKVTELVREVTWSGGRLLDEYFDQFAMQVKLPEAPNTTLYFPVVQECEKGVHRWIEIPEAGKTSRDYREPAPALRLISGGAAH